MSILVFVLFIAAGPGAAAAPGYREVASLNPGLPRLDPAPDLSTPQSSLENFVDSAERGDHARAAYSMDLGAIPRGRQALDGPDLARRLKAVMDEQVWFRWDEVPDRPDGQDDEQESRNRSAIVGQDNKEPAPRANIKLYSLSIGDRDFEIRLERLKPADAEPAWVFSGQTVAHIPVLYQRFGPSRLERAMPEWLRRTRVFKVALWQWAGFALIVLAAFLLGEAVQRGLEAAFGRLDWPHGKAVAEALRGPGALAIGLWSFHELAERYLGLARPIASVLEPFYLGLIIGALAWFLRRLITLAAARFGRHFESFDNDRGNVLVTRLSFARHALTFLVVVGGILLILGRFEWFRQVGATLLASAGVAGIVLGVAAQRVLGNLFAGFLLAVTQPVKSGDAILFEGEFGWIEEIDLTYVVIRTWDLRRLVVPITYLLDRPFENWSRTSQQIIKPVIVHADYRVDVEAVRAEVRAILEGSPDYDRAVPPILQVVACGPVTVELRALCSAGDPASSWNLHCLLRERLVAFLRDLEGGRYLPRRRLEHVDEPREPAESPGPAPEAVNGR